MVALAALPASVNITNLLAEELVAAGVSLTIKFLDGVTVDAIVVATKTITLASGTDLSKVKVGQNIELDSTTDNDGTFTVNSISGLDVTVDEALPGTDQAAPAGTASTVTKVALDGRGNGNKSDVWQALYSAEKAGHVTSGSVLDVLDDPVDSGHRP